MNWSDAIRRTHAERPGITEALLTLAQINGRNPYEWLLEGVSAAEFVVDLGCGSAPSKSFCGTKWLGVDRSESELRVASVKGARPLVQGEMTQLPLVSECTDVVVSSMSMMLVDDSSAAIGEVARILRRGGTARFLIPSRAPLSVRDRLRYARLLGALSICAFFPPSPFMKSPIEVLMKAGFEVVADSSACFVLGFEDSTIARTFVDSLYLPEDSTERVVHARTLSQRWVGSSIGIPLRRIIVHLP